ncbi:hypothetical protein [Rhodococcus sp. ARC_M6]|uniref:hypothetical protein n=1 Tax=Rhodococcus sp. ARC_M6 TaxID=2928852 RepID=UPI001FB3E157|nr:hypothetical protein [Rhodococcus sp. ARC_M6]MCJ0901888.1 hypothetical protein [Rhodococcus sp. ARC_M6]
MFDLRRARAGKLSVRSLIAVAGVAAATFGMAQTTGTMANPTDAVSTTGSQLATGNLFPTPLIPENQFCYTKGSGKNQTVTLEWTAVPGATGYRVEFYDSTNSNPSGVPAQTVIVPRVTGIDFEADRWARIRTLNGPAVSSGYKAAGMTWEYSWSGVGNFSKCSGNYRQVANQLWEDTYEWDPATPDPNGTAARGMAPEVMSIDSPQELIEPPIEAPTAYGTTTPAPTTTTEAPDSTTTTEAPSSSTTTPAPTTSPETTPTEDPKLVLTDTVESGGLTAGWTVGGNKVAVVDADGNELASGRAESGSTLHWFDGQLWIVGSTQVYRIMESPQDGKWKFYKDSGQNMPDFG